MSNYNLKSLKIAFYWKLYLTIKQLFGIFQGNFISGAGNRKANLVKIIKMVKDFNLSPKNITIEANFCVEKRMDMGLWSC